jgi:hypothetical protein
MLTTRRRLASISSFLAALRLLVRLGDDLQSPPQLRRRRSEALFALLQPLAEAALLLAQFPDAFSARAGPRFELLLHVGDLSLDRLQLVHSLPNAFDQVADHRPSGT